MVSKWVVAVGTWAILISEALLLRKWFGFEVAVLVVLAQMWNVMPNKSDITKLVKAAKEDAHA